MPPEVRVQLRLGSLRLEFRGDQSFYEKHVESLVAAAAASGGTASVAPPVPAPAHVDAPRATTADGPEHAGRGGDPAGFVPQSAELGRFIRRLGSEVSEPDRQIVALAFYLWNYEKREVFGTAEIVGCYKALGMKAPEGLDPILADLTDRRRFLEATAPAAWRLSRKGENYVKTRLLVA
jgi:hypothetical protein